MKKKSLAMLLVMVMILAGVMAGCGGDADAGGEGGNSDDGADLPLIGLIQYVEHPSLDMIRENIIAQLAEEGFVDGETVIIDYKNGQQDPNTLKTICQSFTAEGCDLIIAIATPAAQSALGETTEIPIIFSAVTDPVEAQMVDSMDVPGGNVSGTSDAVSAVKIMDLALEITPDVKTVGTVYTASEANSLSVITELKKYAEEHDLKVIEKTVMNTSEIQQAAQSLVGKVDMVFTPIDNGVATAMGGIVEVLNKAGIPFYVGADTMVADGGLATDGVNYVALGKETGKMAAAVLNGADTADMPVRVMDETQIYVNLQTAKEIGVTIPQEVLDRAQVLVEAE